MRNSIIIIAILIASYQSAAQNKARFSSQNYVGMLAGSSETDIHIQTINGLAFNKWFTGIGTGIDWYYYRSIPVFLSGERSFNIKARKKFYLAGAAGVNFPWNETIYRDWNWWSDSKLYPGLSWNAGFGYKLAVGKQNDALLLHIGYSNKFYKENLTGTYPCLVPPCPEYNETFNYNLRALSVKVGWGF